MALRTINLISLCSGVGMLDEGIRAGLEMLGFEARIVLHVEREIAAASQLATLMESGCLEPAPIWDDLTTLDCRPWRGLVDGVVAGFPCQPHSVAGQQLGIDDERWIWPDIARIIRETESAFALLENVPGLFQTAGAEHVVFDIAQIGFDAEWCHLEAASVGASHKRERVFILAYSRRFSAWWTQQKRFTERGDQTQSGFENKTLGDTRHEHVQLQQRCDGTEHSAAGSDVEQSDSTRWSASRCGYEINTKREPEQRCSDVAVPDGERLPRGGGTR